VAVVEQQVVTLQPLRAVQVEAVAVVKSPSVFM
jgi:hypothetical protein